MRPHFFVTVLLVLAGEVTAATQNKAQLTNHAAIVASKTFAWLVANQSEANFQIDVTLIYRFLMQKFASPDLEIMRRYREQARLGQLLPANRKSLLPFISVLEGNPPNPDDTSLHPIDRIVYSSLWCERITLPGDFFQRIADLGRKGDYELTHMYLGLQILKEQRCTFYRQNQARLVGVEAEFVRGLHALVATGKTEDLHIEAAALLFYGKAASAETEKYIERHLNRFENYYDNPYVTRIPAHTTVLLYWALLEYLNPDVRRVPFSGRFAAPAR